MTPPFSSTTPLALARLVAWLVGTLVLVEVVEALSSSPQEQVGDMPPLLFWGLLLAFSPLLLLPYWRYVGWLQAVAAQRATEADRVRVKRWAAVWLGFTLLWLTWLIGDEVAGRLRLGLWADEALAAVWQGLPWELLAFSVVGGAVAVGLLLQLRRWVDAHTRTQADAAARASQLSPRLPALTAWVRAGQLWLLVSLPLTPMQQELSLAEPGVLGTLTAVLTAALDLLILEFSLRFARASASPFEPGPDTAEID